MKVWVTKYAMTRGIEACETDEKPDAGGTLWIRGRYRPLRKGEWHENETAAVTKALSLSEVEFQRQDRARRNLAQRETSLRNRLRELAKISRRD